MRCRLTGADPIIIEIKPHRWGWKVFEAPGVEPVFPEKDQAINYAQNRASFRSGEIRILDSTGNVERTIPFNEADRKLRRPACYASARKSAALLSSRTVST
jgi:hypothetical protein